MPAPFRVLKPFVTYFTNLGTLNAGGYFRFYETETETPKLVYAEPALSTSNGSEIAIDIYGRAENDAWGSGVYRVRMYDVDDDLIAEFDDVQAESPADDLLPDPTGHDGEFLVAQGGVYELTTINQLPDPTDQTGKYIGTADGTGYDFLSFAEVEQFDADNLPGGILDEADYYQIGDTMVQRGSGSASTNGTENVTASVTFSPAFDSTPNVKITVTNGPHNNAGWFASPAGISKSATGFTVNLWAGGEHESGLDTTITSAVNFDWEATGTRDV